jgi:hypothetical protein
VHRSAFTGQAPMQVSRRAFDRTQNTGRAGTDRNGAAAALAAIDSGRTGMISLTWPRARDGVQIRGDNSGSTTRPPAKGRTLRFPQGYRFASNTRARGAALLITLCATFVFGACGAVGKGRRFLNITPARAMGFAALTTYWQAAPARVWEQTASRPAASPDRQSARIGRIRPQRRLFGATSRIGAFPVLSGH